MNLNRSFLTALGVALVFGAASCAPQLSRPITERERTAAIGGLGGGAVGALIGSLTGSAVAGGLFGIPLGAVAGWYIGDQYDVAAVRDRERDSEVERLRRENERLRRESEDIRRPSAQAPTSSAPERMAGSDQPESARQAQVSKEAQKIEQAEPVREQPAQASVSQSPEDIRQAQRALNKMGFDAGSVDGVWGPVTASAIRNFQQSRGIEVTGRLNERTMDELGIQRGQQAQPMDQGRQTQQRQDKTGTGN